MVQPASQKNTDLQSLDTMYDAGGSPHVKLSIGTVDVGLTPMAGWHGVATHMDGDAFNASDGMVVIGGVVSGVPIKAISDSTGRLGVLASPRSGALTDLSAFIAAGGVAQELAAVHLGRKYLLIQNVDPAEVMWIDFTADAVAGAPSIKIPAGEVFKMESSFISDEKVTVIAATTSHPFTVKEA